MHNSHQSFAARQRVLDEMGNSDNMVIWFTDTMPGVPKASQSLEAHRGDGRVDEQHPTQPAQGHSRQPTGAGRRQLLRRQRPADAIAGDDAWNGILDDKPAGACTQRFPLYCTSRIVAGAPIEGGIYKCALQAGATRRWPTARTRRGRRATQRGAAQLQADLSRGRLRLQQAGSGAAALAGVTVGMLSELACCLRCALPFSPNDRGPAASGARYAPAR